MFANGSCTWGDIGVDTLCCALVVVRGLICLRMVYVHEATSVLIRCALVVLLVRNFT